MLKLVHLLVVYLGVMAIGCTDPTPPPLVSPPPPTAVPLAAPKLTALLLQDATGVHAVVEIANQTAMLGYVTLRNPCPVVLEFYFSESLSGPRVWDEWTYLHGCKSFDYIVTIPGHGQQSVASYLTTQAAILGDSLPPGRYWAVAVVVVRQLSDPMVRLPLGPIDLAR